MILLWCNSASIYQTPLVSFSPLSVYQSSLLIFLIWCDPRFGEHQIYFSGVSPETGRASLGKRVDGEGWECAVISQEQRPKAATLWVTGAGGAKKKSFFVSL